MPPVYEDVPPSPPGYGSADRNDGAWGGATIEEYHGELPDYEDLEMMGNDESHGGPSNSGLPMRENRPPSRRHSFGNGEGPSRRFSPARRPLGGLTNEELGAEPPQYALNRRGSGDEPEGNAPEDYAEGTASNAQ